FQAEDGIRDLYVTGVQTCALPILHSVAGEACSRDLDGHANVSWVAAYRPTRLQLTLSIITLRASMSRLLRIAWCAARSIAAVFRSEERRVGKECRSRGVP